MEKQQPQQIHVNLDPNVYAITNLNSAFDEEAFHFIIMSGNQGKQFVANPKHAKRIYLLLKQQIEQYENKFGELKTQLAEHPGVTQSESKVGF